MTTPWLQLNLNGLEHYSINNECKIVNLQITPKVEEATHFIYPLPAGRVRPLFFQLLNSYNQDKIIYPSMFMCDLFPDLCGHTILVQTSSGQELLSINHIHPHPEDICQCKCCRFVGKRIYFTFKATMCDSCYVKRGELIRLLVTESSSTVH